MFRQNTLLISKEVYHEKEKNSNSTHQNESGVSIIDSISSLRLRFSLSTKI